MPLTPKHDAFLKDWLMKRQEENGPAVPPRLRLPAKNQKVSNPKWTDDAWFEARYGDPHYYDRIKGLR